MGNPERAMNKTFTSKARRLYVVMMVAVMIAVVWRAHPLLFIFVANLTLAVLLTLVFSGSSRLWVRGLCAPFLLASWILVYPLSMGPASFAHRYWDPHEKHPQVIWTVYAPIFALGLDGKGNCRMLVIRPFLYYANACSGAGLGLRVLHDPDVISRR